MNIKYRILKVHHPAQVPGHAMYGEFRLPGREFSYLSINELAQALRPGRSLVTVKFDKIWAKPNFQCGEDDFTGPRYDNADPRFPCLLVKHMPNPGNLSYRLIDGRRRMEKLRRQGYIGTKFIVFEYEEVTPYIYDFDLLYPSSRRFFR